MIFVRKKLLKAGIRKPLLFRLFSVHPFPLEELHRFHNGNHKRAQQDGDEVFTWLNAGELERSGEEGNLADQGGGQEGTDGGDEKHPVLGTEPEDASPLGAHVQTVEDLRHGQGQEGHGGTVRAVGDFPDAAFHVVT